MVDHLGWEVMIVSVLVSRILVLVLAQVRVLVVGKQVKRGMKRNVYFQADFPIAQEGEDRCCRERDQRKG
jgi:hypothetical protein